MIELIITAVVSLAVGFVVGILVGRKNVQTVNKAVSEVTTAAKKV